MENNGKIGLFNWYPSVKVMPLVIFSMAYFFFRNSLCESMSLLFGRAEAMSLVSTFAITYALCQLLGGLLDIICLHKIMFACSVMISGGIILPVLNPGSEYLATIGIILCAMGFSFATTAPMTYISRSLRTQANTSENAFSFWSTMIAFLAISIGMGLGINIGKLGITSENVTLFLTVFVGIILSLGVSMFFLDKDITRPVQQLNNNGLINELISSYAFIFRHSKLTILAVLALALNIPMYLMLETSTISNVAKQFGIATNMKSIISLSFSLGLLIVNIMEKILGGAMNAIIIVCSLIIINLINLAHDGVFFPTLSCFVLSICIGLTGAMQFYYFDLVEKKFRGAGRNVGGAISIYNYLGMLGPAIATKLFSSYFSLSKESVIVGGIAYVHQYTEDLYSQVLYGCVAVMSITILCALWVKIIMKKKIL